jgi:hypothetical protein
VRADVKSYPESRKKLKAVGGDTSFIEHKILSLQKGEATPNTPVEKDRDVAKNWFNRRLDSIQQMKLIEGWVADNMNSLDGFMAQLSSAITAVTRYDAGPATMASSKRKTKA